MLKIGGLEFSTLKCKNVIEIVGTVPKVYGNAYHVLQGIFFIWGFVLNHALEIFYNKVINAIL
jgi:hypothetical protein